MAYIKDTTKYPIDEVPQPDDIVIGSKTNQNGKTKNFSVEALASSIGSLIGFGDSTRLISVQEIITNPGFAEVLNAIYQIVGVEYTYSDTLVVEPADDGYYRIDIIIGNAAGLSIRQGDQSEVNPAQPATPIGYVLVGVLNINGEVVSPNLPPGDDVKLKSQEAQQTFESVGNLTTIIWGSRNTYRWGGTSNTTLHSLNIHPSVEAFRYNGRMFFIVNDSSNNSLIRLVHMSPDATGNVPFFFPNLSDLTISKGYIAAFKLFAPSIGVNKLELVSYSAISTGIVYQSIAPYGLPLTLKAKGPDGTLGSSNLEEGDTCFGRYGNIDVVSAIYNGGDPTQAENYTLLTYNEL